METPTPKPKCSQCDSEEILPVVYGLPAPETLARAVLGEVLLGGCVVFGEEPGWRCARCGTAADLSMFAPEWVKELVAETRAQREKPDFEASKSRRRSSKNRRPKNR